jgi:outer membrane protein assembly factor BamB
LKAYVICPIKGIKIREIEGKNTNKTKRTQTIFALILILTMTIFATGTQFANAAEAETWAFISVLPNPVGVGEEVHVAFWLSLVPPTAMGGQGERWENMQVTIEKPDGTTETKGPYTSEPIGAAFFSYVPTMTGVYSFQFSFPGQTLPSTSIYYKPSTSTKAQLTVQQEKIPAWSAAELPTDLWSRPISAENREWAVIAGNWLMPGYRDTFRPFDWGGGAYAPYSKAPNTAHIVWAKPLDVGGLIGGEYGPTNYYTGMSYETKFTPPIIINGVLYYNAPNYPRYGFYAVDLRTGQQLWHNNGTGPSNYMSPPPTTEGQFPGAIPLAFGQVFDYESPNQHGGIPYLWGINSANPANVVYDLYDARTGNWILSLVNGTTGRTMTGPNGEILVYILNGARNWLALWNSTKAIPTAFTVGSGAWQWRPGLGGRQTILDWRNGIQWNKTVPDVPGKPGVQSIFWIGEGKILAGAVDSPIPLAPVDPNAPAFSQRQFPGATFIHIAYDQETGEELWRQNRTNLGDSPPTGWNPPIIDGEYFYFKRETMETIAYDINSGAELWTSDPKPDPFAMYWGGYIGANGKLFHAGYDGKVWAYDIKSGATLWTYDSGNAGLETPYGTWPFYGGLLLADNKVFAANGEHSPGTPMWRGEKLHAIDITTGKGAWNISGWFIGSTIVLGDGYLVGHNGYDNRIYSFGKGPSKTTVQAPTVSVPRGTALTITGTVTDQSPGKPGTPAIADAYMTEWMEYLYMQKPIPGNAKGVQVSLSATDSNGQVTNIGTATSVMSGVFGYTWTPPSDGLYKITATFMGSESYGSSYAETYVTVGSGGSSTQAGALSADLIYMLAAVIIVVIILTVAVAVFILRKK